MVVGDGRERGCRRGGTKTWASSAPGAALLSHPLWCAGDWRLLAGGGAYWHHLLSRAHVRGSRFRGRGRLLKHLSKQA